MNLTKELISPKTCWRAVATSVTRSRRRDEVSKKFKNTQIKINILSGEQEAQWALQSVAGAATTGPFLIADLGGGSLELILVKLPDASHSSFQRGCPMAARTEFRCPPSWPTPP